jgi:SWI/SNF-related matrix-associated actin-dependent regulator of chromatin subfamily A3
MDRAADLLDLTIFDPAIDEYAAKDREVMKVEYRGFIDYSVDMFILKAKVGGWIINVQEGDALTLQTNDGSESLPISVITIADKPIQEYCMKGGIDNSGKHKTGRILSDIMLNKLRGGAGAKLTATFLHSVGETTGLAHRGAIIMVTVRGNPDHREVIKGHLLTNKFPFQDLESLSCFYGFNPRNATGPDGLAHSSNTQVLTEAEMVRNVNAIWDTKEKDLAGLKINLDDHQSLQRCSKSQLYPHQTTGLAWMLKCENPEEAELPPLWEQVGEGIYRNMVYGHTDWRRPRCLRGGLLADDMGLGKSLMTISLILAHPPEGVAYTPGSRGDVITTASSKSQASVKKRRSSLTSSLVDEGNGGQKTIMDLQVELDALDLPTAGSKIELKQRLAEHRQRLASEENKPKAGSAKATDDSTASAAAMDVSGDSGVTTSPEKEDEDDLDDADDDNFGEFVPATLIVSPLSVLSSWQEQLETHVAPGSLRVVTYHGADRHRYIHEFSTADVVLTTYDVVSQDHDDDEIVLESDRAKKRRAGAGSGALQAVAWHRIVLDEAHIIRNMRTGKFKGCDGLSASHRWCLSGTPIINKLDDLNAIVTFLRLEPFCNDPSIFLTSISSRIRSDPGSAAANNLKFIMAQISLHREKEIVLKNTLPKKVEIIKKVVLSHPERMAYDVVHTAIHDYMTFLEHLAVRNEEDENNVYRRNSQCVLALIIRLRQSCLDISLVPAPALIRLLSTVRGDDRQNEVRLNREEQRQAIEKLEGLFRAAGAGVAHRGEGDDDDANLEDIASECAICFEVLQEETSMVFRKCSHCFCERCIGHLFDQRNDAAVLCPMCRTPTAKKDCISCADLRKIAGTASADKGGASTGMEVVQDDDAYDPSRNSSKTNEILNALSAIRENSTRGGAESEKTVIFSSFVGYLDILEKVLRNEGFKFTRLDGRIEHSERKESIRAFTEDPSITVILCSLRAAGVGITLTAANHVFLSDLWWAPAIDHQAVDRVHRIGQNKEVTVTRFLVHNSIDEKIFELQQKKKEMAALPFEKRVANAQNQMRDVQALLGLRDM